MPTERPPLVGEVSANFCGYHYIFIYFIIIPWLTVGDLKVFIVRRNEVIFYHTFVFMSSVLCFRESKLQSNINFCEANPNLRIVGFLDFAHRPEL
jgi:hypothetical protein